jgi:hypothetical protein
LVEASKKSPTLVAPLQLILSAPIVIVSPGNSVTSSALSSASLPMKAGGGCKVVVVVVVVVGGG